MDFWEEDVCPPFPVCQGKLDDGELGLSLHVVCLSADELKSTRTLVDLVSGATRLDPTCAISGGASIDDTESIGFY